MSLSFKAFWKQFRASYFGAELETGNGIERELIYPNSVSLLTNSETFSLLISAKIKHSLI